MAEDVRHLLVLADSLAYHGPRSPVPLTDPRLYPNVMAAALGGSVRVDLLARLGWSAREAWWALTKDPRSWGEYVGRADGLVLAVGGFDQLPAALPSYLREGLAYVRPGGLRRGARGAYAVAAPRVMRLTGGRMRQLPQAATDHYLTRCVEAVRAFRPGIPVVLMGPSPWESALYPPTRGHAPAVVAAREWARGQGTGFVDLDPVVRPALDRREGNPDGLHWGWPTHAAVGAALAHELRAQGWRP